LTFIENKNYKNWKLKMSVNISKIAKLFSKIYRV